MQGMEVVLWGRRLLQSGDCFLACREAQSRCHCTGREQAFTWTVCVPEIFSEVMHSRRKAVWVVGGTGGLCCLNLGWNIPTPAFNVNCPSNSKLLLVTILTQGHIPHV